MKLVEDSIYRREEGENAWWIEFWIESIDLCRALFISLLFTVDKKLCVRQKITDLDFKREIWQFAFGVMVFVSNLSRALFLKILREVWKVEDNRSISISKLEFMKPYAFKFLSSMYYVSNFISFLPILLYIGKNLKFRDFTVPKYRILDPNNVLSDQFRDKKINQMFF